MGVNSDLKRVEVMVKQFAKGCDSLAQFVEGLLKRVEALEKEVKGLIKINDRK